MVGAGVFLSAGFMAQELSPGWILTAWGIGGLLAMAGARAYAEAAVMIPRSGGEYRYLSELFHPFLGYLAGWASLLVGFSAPMAVSAFAAAAFASAVFGPSDARIGAAALIAALTVFHAAGLRLSKWTQNGLVIIKGLLILAFVALGLSLGESQWPSWAPPSAPPNLALSFASSLFFVAYAFSGWNAAAYASEEFQAPRRDVPRAMLIGCALVGIAYLLVNWILVANLSPERAQVVFEYEEARVTLGHLVAQDFLGERGARAMSLGHRGAHGFEQQCDAAGRSAGLRGDGARRVSALLSARDSGSATAGRGVLQGTLAIALLYLHSVSELLSNVAGILVFFSALVAVGLFLASDAVPISSHRGRGRSLLRRSTPGRRGGCSSMRSRPRRV